MANEPISHSTDDIRLILEKANEGYISIDEQSRIIDWNPFATTLFGWEKSEVLGKFLYDFIIPHQVRKAHRDGMAHLLATGIGPVLNKTIEITALHKTKGEFPIELNIFSIKDKNTYTFHAFLRDISARKAAEQLSEKLLESVPDAMIMVNQQGEIIYASSQTENIFGYRKNELLGKQVEMLIPEPYRSRHPKHRENYFHSPYARSMGVGMDLYGQRKNNEIFPVEISLSPIATKDETITLAAIRDITERKKAEATLSELNKQLLNAARHAGMSEIANAILHNLGNILNSLNVSAGSLSNLYQQSQSLTGYKQIANLIKEHSSSLSEYLTKDKKGQLVPDYLIRLVEVSEKEYAEIENEIQHINKNLHAAMSIVSKQQAISGYSILLEKFSIEDSLKSAIAICDLENSNIVIKYDVDTIPLVSSDKNKVLQILINLILNAKESLVASNNVTKCLTILLKNRPDHWLKIAIEDNGLGISPENLMRVFSFGFSTKKGGHGYGLHNSFLLAHELRGSMTAESEGIGKGATFTLVLPIA